MTRILSLALLGTLTGMLSCSSGGREGPSPTAGPAADAAANPPAVAAPAGEFSLPAPATLIDLLPPPARDASYIPADLFREAEVLEASPQRVTPTASGALFQPAYPDSAAGVAGLAYAMYGFQLPGYAGDATVHLSWIATAPAGLTWIGLANFTGNRWDWFEPQSLTLVSVASFEPYLLGGTDLLVCVLRMGITPSELDWLRIGSLPPQPGLTAIPHYGITPFTVQFDAGSSTDTDGSIAEYRWDPEGDGSFTESSGDVPVFSWEYATAGDYQAAVRVVDNNNVYADATIDIAALPEGPFMYGGDAAYEEVYSAIVLDDGSLMLLGLWFTTGVANDQAFVARVTPAGTAQYCKLWGGEENEQIFDAVLAPDGFVYACGRTTTLPLNDADAVLQKWSQDGELVYSVRIGGAGAQERYTAMVLYGDAIYMCGEFYDVALSDIYGLVSRFDLQGNLIWSATLIGPDDCSFTDIAFSADPPTARVCGIFETAANENDCIYAEYDPDGNRLACKLWGNLDYDESGKALSIYVGQSYVLGEIVYGTSKTAFIGAPGGTVKELSTAGGLLAVDVTYPYVLFSRQLGIYYTSVLTAFNSSLVLTSQTEYLGGGESSTVPHKLVELPGGLMIAGKQFKTLPQESPIFLTVKTSTETWEDIFPPEGSPTLGVTATSLELTEPTGLDFNRETANSWEAFVNLVRP